jgi:hypothetical protein
MGKASLSLETAQQKKKKNDLWAIFCPSVTNFLHVYAFGAGKGPEIRGFPAICELAADLQ